MKAIDADDEVLWLKAKIRCMNDLSGSYYCGFRNALEMVLSTVEHFAPAVDQIVRCKDCESAYEECCFSDGRLLHCRRNGLLMKEDGYCSLGRKSD